MENVPSLNLTLTLGLGWVGQTAYLFTVANSECNMVQHGVTSLRGTQSVGPFRFLLGYFMEGMTKLSRLALGGWWWGLCVGACWPAAWRGNGVSSGPVPVCLWCVLLAFGERQPHTIKSPWKPRRYLSKTHNGLHWKPGFDWCEVWDSTQLRIHAARSPEKPDDLE